jgi:hypothetical protein
VYEVGPLCRATPICSSPGAEEHDSALPASSSFLLGMADTSLQSHSGDSAAFCSLLGPNPFQYCPKVGRSGLLAEQSLHWGGEVPEWACFFHSRPVGGEAEGDEKQMDGSLLPQQLLLFFHFPSPASLA